MNLNEIKKILCKEKPIAKMVQEFDLVRIYETNTSLGKLVFEVPYSEMGDKYFNHSEPAQLLIRWINLK